MAGLFNAMPGYVGHHDSRFSRNDLGRGPLLELDDDEVCRTMNIVSRDDEVHTSAGGWQTVFDQNAAVSRRLAIISMVCMNCRELDQARY